MKNNIPRLSLLLILCALTSSCKKTYQYDGVVLSRHGIPVPNVSVSIQVGHGEHKDGGGSINMITDQDGKFRATGKFCYNCFGARIAASSDSGHFESYDIKSQSQSDIQISLQ